MKPHPRIRKTVKWGGAAVTVLLVVVWIGSGWRSAAFRLPGGWSVAVWAGRLRVLQVTNNPRPAALLFILSPVEHFQLRWEFFCSSLSNGWALIVPIWMIVPVTSVSTITSWRLDTLARRRARLNLCPKCNYDRAGLVPNAVCPECGEGSVQS